MGKKYRGVKAASETTIEYTFNYKGVRCRPRIKLKPTAANLARAEKHRDAILYAISEGTFDYAVTFPDCNKRLLFSQHKGDQITLNSYIEAWLPQQVLKATTKKNYQNIFDNFWLPQIGDLMLTEIDRKTIKDKLSVKSCSNKRLANLLSPLRVALNDAEMDELIETNPLKGWTYQRKEVKAVRKKDPIDPFSVEERKAILEACKPEEKHMIKFWFWTGLRPSELIALEWQDIDFIGNTAYIWQSYTQPAKEEEVTKTEAGTRHIDLIEPAMKAINNQKALTYLAGGKVFLDPLTGKKWVGDQAVRNRLWKPLLKRAGVRYRYPYQIRHTYASTMLMGEEQIMWVSKQLGHTNWMFTAKTYSRFIPDNCPDRGKKALEKFG